MSSDTSHFFLIFEKNQSLMKKSFFERRHLLHETFNEVDDQFKFASYRDTYVHLESN